MDEEEQIKPEEYIEAARRLVAAKRYAEAFELYVFAAETHPQVKSTIQNEFRSTLARLNNALASDGKIGVVFNNFERAHAIYHGNKYLLNDIGQHLFKFGYHVEAHHHFQEALKMDSGFVSAEKNLNNIKNFLLERWHFRMLNDIVRNDAYRRAILSSLEPGKDTVLDLGSGTALLTMYASECKPAGSTAVEANETMVDIAQDVIFFNDISQICVVAQLSTSLSFRDIGGKMSLLITELFDAGLLGEHILPSLSHAWEHLLNANARIIPGRAEYFIVGAKCDRLHQKYQLSNHTKKNINIGKEKVHVYTSDTYDCEDIHLVKDIKYMTEPHSLFKINFSSQDEVQEALHRAEPYNVILKAKESGEINLIFGWFNLHLTDDITITTNPTSKCRSNAWQQAVFFDFIPTTVEVNDCVPLQFSTHDDKLALLLDNSLDIQRVQPEVVRFLNDVKYMDLIRLNSDTIYSKVSSITDVLNAKIVDLCPFPMLGLYFMKRGVGTLTCCAKNVHDAAFIERVFTANNVPLDYLKILIGDEFTSEIFAEDKYHLVFNNIVDLCGDVNTDLKDLQGYLSRQHLAPGALVLPRRVSLQVQVVESKWLDDANRLDDCNVHGYHISRFINKYQVSQNIHVDLTHLPYQALTGPASLGDISDSERGQVFDVPVIKCGEANAIICWYTIELIEGGGEISTRDSSSFVEGTVFLADPKVALARARVCHVMRCVDPDGSYKIVLDSA